MKVFGFYHTGARFVVRLLYDNLTTNKSRKELRGRAHTPFKWVSNHFGVIDACLPTMIRFWHNRYRHGIEGVDSFTQFLTTQYQDMPGELPSAFQGYRWLTPPQHWIYYQKHVWRSCNLTAEFPEILRDPVQFLAAVANHVDQSPPSNVTIRFPSETKQLFPLVASASDVKLCLWYQRRFDRWQLKLSRKAPYDSRHYEFTYRFLTTADKLRQRRFAEPRLLRRRQRATMVSNEPRVVVTKGTTHRVKQSDVAND